MEALGADVVDERIEVRRAHRFGPVAGLPEERSRAAPVVVDVVGAAALDAMDQLGEGNGGSKAEHGVEVVGAAPCGQQLAAKTLGPAAHKADEGVVELRLQDRPATGGGPDHVDQQQGGRAARHAVCHRSGAW